MSRFAKLQNFVEGERVASSFLRQRGKKKNGCEGYNRKRMQRLGIGYEKRGKTVFWSLLCAAFALPAWGGVPPPFATESRLLTQDLGDGAATETLPGGFQVVLPAPTNDAQTTDPFYNQRATRAVYVYVFRREPKRQGWFRVATVHHNENDRSRAEQTARLTARLLRLHRERFGQEAVFPRAAAASDVWLCSGAPPAANSTKSTLIGGETRASNVFVWNTQSERSDLEWVRTVAHEWGHLTLPGARGFSSPENDAAGFLGERLFLRWMESEQSRLTPAPQDGTTATELARYTERQTTPLAERFRDGGPLHSLFSENGADAMDYYIGAACAFEDAFGSRLLGQALFSIDGDKPRDLLSAMSAAVSAIGSVAIKLPAWVPLPKTGFLLSGDAKGAVALADRPPLSVGPQSKTPLPVRVAGWKWVRATDGTVRVLTLNRAPTPPPPTRATSR